MASLWNVKRMSKIAPIANMRFRNHRQSITTPSVVTAESCRLCPC
jgi:hypothetical protein